MVNDNDNDIDSDVHSWSSVETKEMNVFKFI